LSFEIAMQNICSLQQKSPIRIRFLTPEVSVTLAAFSVMNREIGRFIEFSPDACSYANTNGLSDLLQGTYRTPSGSGAQGSRYSALTRITYHHEVEQCNGVIADLIFNQLNRLPKAVLGQIVRVVGELHDNVASHSDGVGFSCAQVYSRRDGSREIRIAVADNGVGIRRNVNKIVPGVSDPAALEWAIQRGNTSARSEIQSWEQRIPEDCVISPFPEASSVRVSDDNHMGEGLWQLSEIVRTMSGGLQLASGHAILKQNHASVISAATPYSWQGVVICYTLKLQDLRQVDSQFHAKLDALAERLKVFA
jgi:hypothetical protein